MLTHRNRLDGSLMVNIRARLGERANSKKKEKEKALPEWLTDMLIPHPDDPESFSEPVCVMPTKLDPLASLSARPGAHALLRPGHITRAAFYKLAYSMPLDEVMKHKYFVEFPTIEVWEEGAFTGTIVDDRGSIVRADGEGDDGVRKPKRRKLSKKEGKKALGGLLGGYGSNTDEDEGEDAKEEKNVFNLLAGYEGSDDENKTGLTHKTLFDSQFDYELGDEDAEGETDDGMGEYDYDEDEPFDEEDREAGGGKQNDPEAVAVLLEQLRQAGALRDPGDDHRFRDPGDGDDDQVDWGDSADEADHEEI
ncbi:hypothetical protein EW026_g138 [Hermanssonia centrifuga]|uniref:BCD1 alpha/beta domain-containing protein n=1 Tax=Hermanssonia centrifuga TaxID=98765 RepID=A0A4S4KVW3_9APHY|nr:hypothetical protein EW026_g138 [Hermanssonia centrifuga]